MADASRSKVKEHRPDAYADEAIYTLIQLVGKRVRALRKTHCLTRRELSEVSGVSQRYLAQLESGEGNISIGLLMRISLAFKHPIEAIVCEESEHESLVQLIANFKQADSEIKNQIQHLLDPVRMRERKAERVCLLGLRGAGKSTLGTYIAAELNVPFIALNTEIERVAGIPLSEIIELYGQEGYRQLESDVLNAVIGSHKRLVLAVPGGIVTEPKSFSHVLSKFHTVWIQASASEHIARVSAKSHSWSRAENSKAVAQLKQILDNRESLYSQAEHQLNTKDSSVATSKTELLQLLRARSIINEL